MKKQLQFLALSLGLCAMSIVANSQTTRRVNGDPNITGVNVYNTIQAAVDAANTDDVILIEPFGDNPTATRSLYMDPVSITKRVHLRGNGYKLEDLTNVPFDKRTVQVWATIDFDTGSAGSSMKYIDNESGIINIYDENITIESCELYLFQIGLRHNSSSLISKGTGVKILKCFNRSSGVLINLPNISTISDLADSYSSNLEIKNSYIIGVYEPSFVQYKASGITISNSTIESQVGVTNSTIINSIFLALFDPNLNQNTAVSHCISTSSGLPILSNNTNNVLLDDIWVGGPGGYSFENLRFLKPTSIAKGYGINGEDIGEYGGNDPYRLSGLPHSPIITDLQNTQVGNDNINIQVQATYIAN